MRTSSQVASARGIKVVALVMVFGLAFYLLAPPSLWQRASEAPSVSSAGADQCPVCNCECAENKVISIPDCAKVEVSVIKEVIDKNSMELLSEELKLHEKVYEENQMQADSALLDAKKLASQYQKEAEKCNAGVEKCEEAREKLEAALVDMVKVSAMWEKRARELGWHDRSDHQSTFSRTSLTSESGVEDDSFFISRQ